MTDIATVEACLVAGICAAGGLAGIAAMLILMIGAKRADKPLGYDGDKPEVKR